VTRLSMVPPNRPRPLIMLTKQSTLSQRALTHLGSMTMEQGTKTRGEWESGGKTTCPFIDDALYERVEDKYGAMAPILWCVVRGPTSWVLVTVLSWSSPWHPYWAAGRNHKITSN